MNDYFTNNGRSNQVVLGTTAEGMSALIPQEIDGHLADKLRQTAKSTLARRYRLNHPRLGIAALTSAKPRKIWEHV